MKEQLEGKIVVLHQPAEEVPPGGAIGMINAGALEGVDTVFDIRSDVSDGQRKSVLPRNVQTGHLRQFHCVKIQGVGGHGSSPHKANDAIVAASYFVVAVQSIVSRRMNPFDVGSITIGSFDGKGSFNVIKDSVVLEGDVRSMSEETRTLIERKSGRSSTASRPCSM